MIIALIKYSGEKPTTQERCPIIGHEFVTTCLLSSACVMAKSLFIQHWVLDGSGIRCFIQTYTESNGKTKDEPT